MPGLNCDEWIPIRPGTDAAMALAMINLLLNEYGIYDSASIRQYTNGPYLVGTDGLYLRDKVMQKPLMWDLEDGKAKTYDAPTLGEPALEGSYCVEGARSNRLSHSSKNMSEHIPRNWPRRSPRFLPKRSAGSQRIWGGSEHWKHDRHRREGAAL